MRLLYQNFSKTPFVENGENLGHFRPYKAFFDILSYQIATFFSLNVCLCNKDSKTVSKIKIALSTEIL